jgi:hypothetical protein
MTDRYCGREQQQRAMIDRRQAGRSRFPGGARFAFTILDDTDDSTVDNVRPVYDLLDSLRMRTTKTVWPLESPEGSELFFAGETLSNPSYRDFCVDLKARGFEVTWHGATMESSDRERTIRGMEAFRSVFGEYPRVHVNHGQNRENLYWGHHRYRTAPVRGLSRLLKPRRPGERGFEGDVEGSQFFWGDLCRERCRFVRNLTFYEINTLRADANTPYRLKSTPWVQYWFSTSDAPDVEAFRRVVTRASIQRLESEGGVCILSTHLGKGFVRDGIVDEGVATVLRDLASRPGWFVPVSEVLEYLISTGPARDPLPWLSLARLEFAHAYDRLRGPR